MNDDWLKIGYYIFIPDYEMGSGFAIVTHREPLIYETTSTEFSSSVATGSNSGFIEIENLEPRKSPPELYDLLFGFDDPLKYLLKHPSGVDRFNPNKIAETAYITSGLTHRYAMDPRYRIFLLNGDSISFRADNSCGYTITPKIYFEGMKYNIKPLAANDPVVGELKSGKLIYTPIPRGVKT